LKQHCNSILLGCALAIATFLPSQAFAEVISSIHPDLRGNWAIDSCAGGDGGILVVRGTMSLMIEGGDATSLALVADQSPDDNGWINGQFESEDASVFLRRVVGNPDRMEFANPATDTDSQSLALGPGANPDPSTWETMRFENCPALPLGPQALYGELIAVLDGIDNAELACSRGPEQCASALFAIADVHPDGVLTVAEISRMLRVLVQLGAIEQGNGAADTQVGMIAASVPLAPILARAIVSSFDYDGDNALSLDEILQDRVVLPSSDMSAVLSGAEARVSEMMTALETRAGDLGRLLMMLR
jgi:hypothetical protein